MTAGASTRFFPADGTFPIELSGADADGHPAVYFVKPEDARSSKYRLRLDLRNVGDRHLRIPAKASPSPGDYHFRLRFRPGIVDGRNIRKALPLSGEVEQQLGVGWRWHDLHTDTGTGEIRVCFSYAPDGAADDFEWRQGQSLGIRLRPFQNAPLSGAYFLKVEVDYGSVPGLDTVDHAVKVRQVNLAVVDMSGGTFFPGRAVVLGSNTVPNNGEISDRLTVRLWNAVHHSVLAFRSEGVDRESGSSITVAVRCQEDGDGDIGKHPSVLGTKNQLQHLSLEVKGIRWGGQMSSAWNVEPHLDEPGWLSWVVTPNSDRARYEIGRPDEAGTGVEVLEALEFCFDELKISAPSGSSDVHLHFHNLPGLADHTLLIPLEKGPIVIRGQNVGVGRLPPAGSDGDLYLGGRVHDRTGELMPVGAVVLYAGTVPPPGWLVCDGTPIDATAHNGRYRELGRRLGRPILPLVHSPAPGLTYLIKY